MKLIIYILIIFSLTSCITAKKVLEYPEQFGPARIIELKDSTSIDYTIDTVSDFQYVDWSNAYSTILMLYLECDSANQVYLKQVIELKNEGEKVIYKYKLTDNTLTLETICAELRRQLEIEKNKTITNDIVVTVEKKVDVIVYKVAWWGWVLIVLALFVGLIIGVKIK